MPVLSRIVLSCVGALVLLSGCASYTIQEGGEGKGYDVFQPEPYLLLKRTDNGYSAEILWLPNYTKRYRISTCNFLAKADFQFTITDGWKLTSISDKSDNTAAVPKLLELLGPLVVGLAPANNAVPTKEPGSQKAPPDIRLFRMVFCEDTGVMTKLVEVKLPW
jgi:hypothetical protein